MSYILDDSKITKKLNGDDAVQHCIDITMKNLGKLIVVHPPDQYIKINPTMEPGATVKLYHSLVFQLPKWEYDVKKMDEYVEVSPVSKQYYQLTMQQKQQLEQQIKQGLANASQAVSDYELLHHDERKYRRYLKYLGLKFNGEEFVKEGESDEHSLKSIFIDQVDYHTGSTGQGAGRLSMAFMQQNNIFPTIMQDFYEMDKEEDLKEKDRLSDLPVVEKNMLKSKWRAYQQWKNLFMNEVKDRYRRIWELKQGREKSIDEYRNWLKPYIARHKLLEEGLGRKRTRAKLQTLPPTPQGIATSKNEVKLWVWKDMLPREVHAVPGEIHAKKPVHPYNHKQIKALNKKLIFDEKDGLKSKYPWITEEWVEEKVDEIVGNEIDKNKHYYAFGVINFDRTNFRYADGAETEDVDIYVEFLLLTHNAMLVKLLEAKAHEEELNRYINQLLGIHKEKFNENEKKTKNGIKIGKKASDFFSWFGLNFNVLKRGPYESNVRFRMTKFFFKRMGRDRFGQITNFIKSKIGYGVS